jgi:dTDP-4-dehydrorhamnose 3,5-epimerase
MKFIETKIEGAWIIEPKVFRDERGSFSVTWNQGDFKTGIQTDTRFVQMNHSKSKHNVLRGLHYQCSNPQAKLVWVTSGYVLDVFVDLRKGSPTFGKWDSVVLGGNTRAFIPAGCAHGFIVKSHEADFHYLVDDYRFPEYERTLMWNDPDLGIEWDTEDPILSEKDKQGHLFKDFK